MSDDYSYLSMRPGDRQVLRNLSEMGEHLKELRKKMLEAEAQAESAKKEYEHYANVIVPQEMFSAGVDEVSLASGGRLSIKHNFYCQPNKNTADRKVMTDWLIANGGGYLVKQNASVSSDDVSRLRESGIPYVESTSINTASLKSFLKDGIGATSGVQRFSIDDIPACMHFQEVTTTEIILPKE